MAVDFIKTVRESLKFTYYKLGKHLGLMANQVENFEKKGKMIPPVIICKIRLLSGKSWNEFGKMLDDEFLK